MLPPAVSVRRLPATLRAVIDPPLVVSVAFAPAPSSEIAPPAVSHKISPPIARSVILPPAVSARTERADIFDEDRPSLRTGIEPALQRLRRERAALRVNHRVMGASRG